MLLFAFSVCKLNAQCTATLGSSSGNMMINQLNNGPATFGTINLSSCIPSGQSSTVNFDIVFGATADDCGGVNLDVYAEPGHELIYTAGCNIDFANCPGIEGVHSITFIPSSAVCSLRFRGRYTGPNPCGFYATGYGISIAAGASVSTTYASSPSATASVSSNVTCAGASTGSASVSPSGGTPGYTYAWSNGGTGASISSVPAGNYNVVVTDANGCNVTSNTVTVSQPASAPNATASVSSNVSCSGASTGSASVSPSGGTPGYTYAWNNGGTGSSISSITAGNYNVVVTDANGCNVTSNTVTVSQPASAPNATASVSSNVTCSGASTGSASVSPSGGTPGYTYAWSNGGTGSSISSVPAGNYNVVVTDANGCNVTSNTVTVSQPSAVLAATASVTGNVTTSGGSDGSASVSVAGGTAGYTYAWSNGGTGASISGLPIGSYSVNVTDANGCFITSNTIIITDPNTPLSASITSSSNVTCTGANNGTASASAVGGAPGYIYAWSNGATTPSITGLAAGTYSVTVTDANSNVVTTSAITITQPTSTPSASASVTSNVSCVGASTGSANVIPSGGTSGYTYAWSNGSTGASISSVPAGNYNVVVTDANGCNVTSNTVIVSEPSAALAATASVIGNVTTVGGSDGSASVSVAGGTAGYTYAWSNGGTGTSITGLPIGSYSVNVTDANGCFITSNTIIITDPNTPLSATITSSSNVTCTGANNGTASVSAVGGAPSYTYVWSNGATTQHKTLMA